MKNDFINYPELELRASLLFWSQNHTFGSRRRVKEAILHLHEVRG